VYNISQEKEGKKKGKDACTRCSSLSFFIRLVSERRGKERGEGKLTSMDSSQKEKKVGR